MGSTSEVRSVAPVLKVQGLRAGYHGNAVVHGIDFEVRPGEVVALVGPNGAGKTTTLNAIAGNLRRIAGEVTIAGGPASGGLHRLSRRGLGYVTEDRAVFMNLSVSDNLRLGRGDLGRAYDLFPELVPLQRRSAGNLSGGEQQVLTVARALSRAPKVLLIDELSLGLAPLIVTRLLGAVRRAATDDGAAVLLVEQYVHQAVRYADRLYALKRGQVVLQGRAQEVAPLLEDAYLAGAAHDDAERE